MDGIVKFSLKRIIEQIGEDRAKEILSDFQCPLNADIEDFLKKKAVEFEKQSISATHLIYTSYKGELVLVGYYTLANKVFTVTKGSLNSRLSKRINKFAKFNPDIKSYVLSAPLIAQLGKNYSNGYDKLISGDELLKWAIEDVQMVQQIVGGKVVYLECEDKPRLKDFYSSNGFVPFGKRQLDGDETNLSGEYLIQMLRYLE